MKTIEERLNIAEEYSNLAFRLINELWIDKHEGLILDQDTLTNEQRAIRTHIVDTRIAILKISNEIEMIKIGLGLHL
jgi:hypothetical protein